MNIEIVLDKHGDGLCTLSNSSKEGMCFITINEGTEELSALVDIEKLKVALRKLTVK